MIREDYSSWIFRRLAVVGLLTATARPMATTLLWVATTPGDVAVIHELLDAFVLSGVEVLLAVVLITAGIAMSKPVTHSVGSLPHTTLPSELILHEHYGPSFRPLWEANLAWAGVLLALVVVTSSRVGDAVPYHGLLYRWMVAWSSPTWNLSIFERMWLVLLCCAFGIYEWRLLSRTLRSMTWDRDSGRACCSVGVMMLHLWVPAMILGFGR